MGRLKESWRNKMHAYAAMTATLLGIRNIVSAPYLMYRHGAIPFLLCYVLVMAIISFPVLYVETVLSQFTHSGNRGIFNCCPLFRGISYSMAFFTVAVNIPLYTTVSQALLYFLRSLEDTPPWSTCSNGWIRDNSTCYVPEAGLMSCDTVGRVLAREYRGQQAEDGYPLLYHNDITMVPTDVFKNRSRGCVHGNTSSVAIFFDQAVLNIGHGVDDIFGVQIDLVFVSAVVFLLIFAILYEGFINVRYTFYVLAVLQYLLIILLLGISLSFTGAVSQIAHLFNWSWGVLVNVALWQDVIAYSAFGIGLGGYGMMYITSHNGFQNDYVKDMVFILATDFVTSIMCAMMVLLMLAHNSSLTGLYMDQIITTDVLDDILFVDIPQTIMMMPNREIVSSTYFLLLFVMGIGTLFLTTEIVLEVITEEYPHHSYNRRRLRGIISIVCCVANALFLTPAGPYLKYILTTYLFNIVGSINIILEVLVIFQFYGLQRVLIDSDMMLDHHPGKVVQVLWTAVIPIILLITLVLGLLFRPSIKFRDYDYPVSAKIIVAAVAVMSLSFIPSYAYAILAANEFNLDIVRHHATRWRPADSRFAREYKSRLLSKGLFVHHHRREGKQEGKQGSQGPEGFSTTGGAPPMSTGMFVVHSEDTKKTIPIY